MSTQFRARVCIVLDFIYIAFLLAAVWKAFGIAGYAFMVGFFALLVWAQYRWFLKI